MMLLIRNKNGRTFPFDVEELLEIDGRPFQAGPAPLDVESTLQHFDGRLSAIESILGLQLQTLTEQEA